MSDSQGCAAKGWTSASARVQMYCRAWARAFGRLSRLPDGRGCATGAELRNPWWCCALLPVSGLSTFRPLAPCET